MATTAAERRARIMAAAERIHTIRQVGLTIEDLGVGLAHDLAEVQHEAAVLTAEAYAVTLQEADGTESATAIQVLVLRDARRAGVCAGGNQEWTHLDRAPDGGRNQRRAGHSSDECPRCGAVGDEPCRGMCAELGDDPGHVPATTPGSGDGSGHHRAPGPIEAVGRYLSYRFGDEVGVHWPGGVLFCIPVERLEAVCAKVAP